jgi:hypothetical protein
LHGKLYKKAAEVKRTLPQVEEVKEVEEVEEVLRGSYIGGVA